jgi:hypothetical protein
MDRIAVPAELNASSGEHAGKADDEKQEHAAEYDRYRSFGCKDLIHA